MNGACTIILSVLDLAPARYHLSDGKSVLGPGDLHQQTPRHPLLCLESQHIRCYCNSNCWSLRSFAESSDGITAWALSRRGFPKGANHLRKWLLVRICVQHPALSRQVNPTEITPPRGVPDSGDITPRSPRATLGFITFSLLHSRALEVLLQPAFLSELETETDRGG